MCPSCHANPATIHPTLGVLPCRKCQDKQAKLISNQIPQEMTSESIKTGRKEFFDDYHPAHRSGVPSAEFRDRWGAKAMKKQGFSDEEIKGAKKVWNGDKYYSS